MSGVTLWFDPGGRLTKINLHGVVGALYSEPNSIVGENWIASDRPLVFGLTAHATESDFASVLGVPVSQNEAGSTNRREVRRVWRKDSYLIDALFLASDRTEDGRKFPKGALLWFEVSRGL